MPRFDRFVSRDDSEKEQRRSGAKNSPKRQDTLRGGAGEDVLEAETTRERERER
eukprot:COSAG03_NODE_177_length_11096_cov_1567.562062_1_plen_53_part_10